MKLTKTDLWTRLQSVSKFSVATKDTTNCWSATGTGVVLVEHIANNMLVWREKGTWDQSLGYLEFSNVYRWTKTSDNKFQLGHLRYGDDQPVKLVEIRSDDNDYWQSTAPHFCGQDEYDLDLSLTTGQLILDWKIEGQNKDQHSTVYYS